MYRLERLNGWDSGSVRGIGGKVGGLPPRPERGEVNMSGLRIHERADEAVTFDVHHWRGREQDLADFVTRS